MGYYSDFTLTITKSNGEKFTQTERDNYIDGLHNIDSGFEDVDPQDFERISVVLNGAKWYEAELDLKKYTLDNPGLKIHMYREGEADDDFDRMTFSGGRTIEYSDTVSVLVPHVSEPETFNVALMTKGNGNCNMHVVCVSAEEYGKKEQKWKDEGIEFHKLHQLDVFGTKIL